MTNYIQANTDGCLHPADQPSISPLNRGFLYGDAIYEVWRTYHGTLFGFEEHWTRLEQSAKALFMDLPLTREELVLQARRTIAAFVEKTGGAENYYVRLQITRGAGPIGLDIALADKPSYVILVQALKPMPEKWMKNGMRLSVATELHRLHADTVNPAWKTGNYLNSILCLREAQARGADEVLMTNLAGEITEAAVSNFFFVRGQTVVTPPLNAGILAGVTRRWILEKAAERAGVEVREEAIRVDQLKTFQECCITSTTKEITPVGSIDDVQFAVGPNTITAKLQTAFADCVHEYIAAHPELKVTK